MNIAFRISKWKCGQILAKALQHFATFLQVLSWALPKQEAFQDKLRCSKLLYTVDVEVMEGLTCDFVRTQRGMGRRMSLACLRRTGTFK